MKIYKDTNLAIEEIKNTLESNSLRFQELFSDFVVSVKHDIVVETGSGISTVFLLNRMRDGHLYSVDYEVWSYKMEGISNHTLITGIKSQEYLLTLFENSGPWDIFLHDSDHEIGCMTYELESAYGFVNPGGYIACDDRDWNSHGAWNKFVKKYNLNYYVLDSLAIVQKPHSVPVTSNPKLCWETALELSKNEERNWKNGNK
jgi:predicted O-methyltransferase YrrM